MMSKNYNRLSALEDRSVDGVTQIVAWHPGLSFDDCLLQSKWPADAGKRMLLRVRLMEHGFNGLVPQALSPEEQIELDKARAWAEWEQVTNLPSETEQ